MPVSACPRCGQALDPASDRANCPRCGQPVPIPLGTPAGHAPPPGPGGVRLPQASLSGVQKIAPPPAPVVAPPPSSVEIAIPRPGDGEHLVRRLRVVDGADQGQSFLLDDHGVVTVGSSAKHANVCLHDLYVARVHCQIAIEGDQLQVTSCEAARPTFINGKQIQQEFLAPGDVLRVGNSYLRLDLEVASATPPRSAGGGAVAAPAGPAKVPRLPLARLGDLAGHTLGHFELGKPVGAGLYGVTFRAKDLKTEQEVALKVLPAEFPADEAEMQQFARAMRPVLTLRHPCLAALYGVGKSGPYCWIARELVQGLSLAQMISPGKSRTGLDWRLALRVAVHVGRALEVVHRQHLTHRNVTPQNILLEGDEGQVKLNDVMFRKAVEGSALWQAAQENQFLADLPYLAPEQVTPDAFVDDLCDIYSLGVVVYALMTGRLPFRGKTPEETLEQIREDVPQKPKKFERSIPTAFQEIVLKMMAKRQEDRYARPEELLADLNRLAEQRNVTV